jgi:hypothetical protein
MAHAAPVRTKIPTKNPQPARAGASRPARAKAGRVARSRVFAGGAGRPATRGDGNPVIELEYGITVYPAREGQDRWRAVWYENGNRRQCEARTEERLAARLEQVTERLAADAPNMERTGADLIAHYLDPDRLPADRRWSRKHAHTQRRLCERFAVPVIGDVPCQDIKTWHMQQVVNAAPTAQEGARVHGMISALVAAGIEGGYLANPRLAKVHWQAGDRPLPAPRVSVAGESGLWVDPAEIPSADDVERLGKALAAGRHGERDQLMAAVAAYSGLRWGEIAALTVPQVDGRPVQLDVACWLGDPVGGQQAASLAADRLSGMFLALTFGAAVPVSVAFASWAARPDRSARRGLGASYALALGAVAVVMTATDAFTALFGWETLTLAFYLLAGSDRHKSGRSAAAQVTFAFGKVSGAALLAGLLLLAARSHSILLACRCGPKSVSAWSHGS